ncbi:hypothetical protein M9H77_35662 [Catharanthus roseus]|uniref:Uncharacterized protein n=1 Tax=Catharanthus roseus TaxID=4058 RepID=A0ACB9ZPM8_CATRO|nr:hypothetical protein M9H77_35662 [Catharanthus roseus]
MENFWILDSGCSNHMTGRKIFLQNLHPISPHIIGLPNGAKTFAMHEGVVSLSPTLQLHRVDTSEPSQEYTLELELEPETNESSKPTSVPESNEPDLGNSDDDEDHPEAQAQALRDYQPSRDVAYIFLVILLIMPSICFFMLMICLLLASI